MSYCIPIAHCCYLHYLSHDWSIYQFMTEIGVGLQLDILMHHKDFCISLAVSISTISLTIIMLTLWYEA